MKNLLLLILFSTIVFNSQGQINQISIGLGRTDQWVNAEFTSVGDTAIAYSSQPSMDSRTIYMVTMDQVIGKFPLYHSLAFSVMFPEFKLYYPVGLLAYNDQTFFMKAPTFDYSINTSLLKPSRRLSLFGGLNVRVQWPLKLNNEHLKNTWLYDWAENGNESFTPLTLGLNLNLRYQTRWLRIEFGYIGDLTSSSRNFEHNGQTLYVAPAKMQKIYLVFSGPIFRREKPPKRLKKKDFIL